MLDRKRRRRIRNWSLGFFGPPAVRNWARTLRFRWIADEIDTEDGRIVIPNMIVVVWHQRLFALASRFANSDFSTLVSRHADGEMLARVLEGLGLTAIRGSSTRGGAQAVRELMRKSSGPIRIAITPDGPRGPAQVLQSGAVYLASKTGLPIYCAAIGLDRPWQLRSWDRFWLPRPFSRALLRVSAPITVPPDLDRAQLETWRASVEAELQRVTQEADERFDELWQSGARWRGFVRSER